MVLLGASISVVVNSACAGFLSGVMTIIISKYLIWRHFYVQNHIISIHSMTITIPGALFNHDRPRRQWKIEVERPRRLWVVFLLYYSILSHGWLVDIFKTGETKAYLGCCIFYITQSSAPWLINGHLETDQQHFIILVHMQPIVSCARIAMWNRVNLSLPISVSGAGDDPLKPIRACCLESLDKQPLKSGSPCHSCCLDSSSLA